MFYLSKLGRCLIKPTKAGIIVGLCIMTVGVAFAVSKAVHADEPTSTPADLPDTVEPESIDDVFGRIADEIPEFAGIYYVDDVLHINVTSQNPTLNQSVLSAVENEFGAVRDSKPQVVYDTVEYGYTQLLEWYGPFRNIAFSFEEVTGTTIDEKNNKLKVGVATLDSKPVVEEALVKEGIPFDVIEIQEIAPFQAESLSDYTRPLVGGLRITRSGGGNGCTLGFNGIRGGIWGFVTNSHCTISMGQNDGTIFYQAGIGIGAENASSDPAFFTGGVCPLGKQCRYSDAAYINKYGGTTMTVGQIARPSSSDHSEPIDWNGTNTFRIVGERPPILGETIIKIGASTGWTTGTISDTSFDAPSNGAPNAVILDQALANYSSQDGDSGSPVVRVTNSPNANDVLLLGIHWGSSGDTKAFSPIGKHNIKRSSELGGFVAAQYSICPACRNWDHYYVWRGGSQSTNKAVWWSANEFIARYPEVKYVQFNSGGGSSGWADSAYIKFCPDLNANGEPINCIGERYVSNINDYGTTTVTYSTPLQLQAGRKYWFSVNTGGSNKVLLYYSNYGSTDYTEGCNKWQDGTLHNSCSIDLNGTVEATGAL